MNKIYLAIIALLALTSCANTYEIRGTSNVSTLDGRMLYLKILKDNNFKSIDSCDVLHGQFHFQGNLDSVKMGNIFMDDEPVLPLVLESGDITVKLDDAQQIVSGTHSMISYLDFSKNTSSCRISKENWFTSTTKPS